MDIYRWAQILELELSIELRVGGLDSGLEVPNTGPETNMLPRLPGHGRSPQCRQFHVIGAAFSIHDPKGYKARVNSHRVRIGNRNEHRGLSQIGPLNTPLWGMPREPDDPSLTPEASIYDDT